MNPAWRIVRHFLVLMAISVLSGLSVQGQDIISIIPDQGSQGEQLSVTIMGLDTQFALQESGIWAGIGQSSATAFSLTNTNVVSPVEFSATVDIPGAADPGLYNVYVIGANPLIDGFEVLGCSPGCMDDTACNYDPVADCDDGSCTYPGCTDDTACNYDSSAGCDDGSCTGLSGCIGPLFCNYNPDATCDDGSCEGTPGCTDPLSCDYEPDADCDDGSCGGQPGCINPSGCNYDPLAACDDGSCVFPGCTDDMACNYDPDAGCDDGSCDGLLGCTDDAFCNYDPAATCDDGSCASIAGCMDVNDCNYNPDAVCDDGSCEGQPGCTDSDACNYDSEAGCDDGSCTYSGCTDPAYCNYDPGAGCDDGSCTGTSGCMDNTACNYDVIALCDDGSCTYPGCTNPLANNYDPDAGCDDGSCDVPTISFITPDEGFPGETLGVTIIGVNTTFAEQESGLWAGIGQSSATAFAIEDLDVESNTQLDGIANIPEFFAPGFYNLYVTGVEPKIDAFEVVCPGGIPGCDDPAACNYDPIATCSDGSCQYPGCTTPGSCNYDPDAGCDDGSCAQWDACFECGGDGTLAGCMDSGACNYNSFADCDDGSCSYPGCTDDTALNYDPDAGCDDGSCVGVQTIIDIVPDQGEPGQTLQVTIIGAGTQFTQESGLWAGIGQSSATAFVLTDIDISDNEHFDATASIPGEFTEGLYNVYVSGANELIDGFAVICPGGTPGCDDPGACNFDPLATCSDGSCVFPGCTTITACNFDPDAGCDDGSCLTYDACLVCGGDGTTPGCEDPGACNFNPSADCDDGSCTFPGCTDWTAVNYDPDAGCDDGSCVGTVSVIEIDPDIGLPNQTLGVTIIGAGTIFTQESGLWAGIGQTSQTAFVIDDLNAISDTEMEGTVTVPNGTAVGWYNVYVSGANELIDGFFVSCPGGPGCDDPLACNYDPLVGCNDGSCQYPGCMDDTACNYDPDAGCDDGSCEGVIGCMVMTACNYNPAATCNFGCMSSGCTDPLYCNYDPDVECDNGTCSNLAGCTDPDAANYNEFAGCDDGSCIYSGCTDPNACNYSPVYNEDDGNCIYGVSGIVYNDLNENGIHNDFEPGMENWQLIIQPGNLCTYTADGGSFYMELTPGEYTITIENYDDVNWNATTALEYTITVGTCFELDFGFTPANPGYSFFTSQENSIFFPYIHCDDGHYPGVWFFNNGTAPLNGTITVNYPPFFEVETLINTAQPDVMGAGIATWSLNNYPPGQDDIFAVHLLGPGPDYIGEFYEMQVEFTFTDFNELPEYTSAIVTEPEVVCAYDPNDKYSVPEGYTEEYHFVNPGDEIEFRIRFQNTGNFPAEDIIVLDTLDTNLDWNTFVPEYASHEMYTTFNMDNGAIEFRFDDIFLPDSVNNEPESHGFIVYTVHPKEDLLPWTVIENTAHIFFDSNPAIVTNTTWHTIMDCDAITEFDVEDYSLCLGDSTLITASSEFADSVVWYWDDIMIGDGQALWFEALETGNQDIFFEVHNELCVETEDFYVEVNDLPQAFAGDDQEICEGETAELSASGGVDYQWDGIGTGSDQTVSPDLTTDYQVIVTDDNGCSDIDEVTVFVNPLPTADVTENGAELTATAGESYQWFLNGQPIDGATEQVYVASEDGSYSVEVTNEFGCSDISDEIDVIIDSIWENDDLIIVAYPNPARDILYIQVEDGWHYDLKIFDAAGRLAAQRSNITDTLFEVNCDLLGSGTYTLTLVHSERLITKRIVIE